MKWELVLTETGCRRLCSRHSASGCHGDTSANLLYLNVTAEDSDYSCFLFVTCGKVHSGVNNFTTEESVNCKLPFLTFWLLVFLGPSEATFRRKWHLKKNRYVPRKSWGSDRLQKAGLFCKADGKIELMDSVQKNIWNWVIFGIMQGFNCWLVRENISVHFKEREIET